MYALSQHTAVQFQRYMAHIAKLNGVSDTRQAFNVAPAPQQRIVQAYQLAVDFLAKVNVITVKNAQGEKIQMDVGTTIAKTNATSQNNWRQPVVVGALEDIDTYLCAQTDYDVAYPYNFLDAWSHIPEFATMLQAMVVKAIAQDKLRIGFNGVSRAATSDRVANPNLEDVNIGWLQKIRTWAPERTYEGVLNAQTNQYELKVGAGQEFQTLDGLVQGAVENLIAYQYRDDPDLTAICGRGMLVEKYLPLLNTPFDPINQNYARTIYKNRVLGTLPVEIVPWMPANKILITNPKNLSIYLQEGTIRRRIVDEPHLDRYADYQSVDECYVVENYQRAALIENIELL